MTPEANAIIEAVFIDTPRDTDLRVLYEYWNTVRGNRAMPRRADINPGEIPKLLPHVIMYNVQANGGYTIRLVGGEVERFVGRNMTGQPAGSTMAPLAAEMMTKILDAVSTERIPKYRIGKAHWHSDKSFRDFEACFLPLSSDGEAVDIILGGIKFPTTSRT